MTHLNSKELIELRLKLLSIHGESKNERKVADVVISYCQNLGLEVKEDDAAKYTCGNAGNIICSLFRNSNSKNIYLLNFHLDTLVPTRKAVIKHDEEKIYTGNKHGQLVEPIISYARKNNPIYIPTEMVADWSKNGSPSGFISFYDIDIMTWWFDADPVEEKFVPGK